jgi:hypothetical protein
LVPKGAVDDFDSRPAAMFIEKSYDWGKNWTIHRYFSADCEKDFPGVTIGESGSIPLS